MRINITRQDNKRSQGIKVLTLCLFMYVLYVTRIPFGLVSDDKVVAETIHIQTLWENFMFRWNYNGRFFTDVLANVFYRMPILIWKVFDVVVYARMAVLISRIFTKNSWQELLTVCVLVLLFPMNYLDSAGYIVSTTNYVYPVACLLEVAWYIFLVRSGKHVSHLRHAFTTLFVLYITNHDQSGMVLIGGLFLYLLYNIATKAERRVIINAAFWLVFSVSCYLFMFMTPGHIYRMKSTGEMKRWLPQYANWSLLKKLYHGYSTTVANFFFSNVKLFDLFVLLLFILSLSQNVFYKKLIAAIPMAVMILSELLGRVKFIVYFDYSCGMPDLIQLHKNIIPALLTGICVCSIFYTVWSCVEKKQNKWLMLMLLVLAAGSREMMGLSATIYASSFRTFTFFLYAIIACCLLSLQELKDNKDSDFWHSGLGAIAAMWIR